jgi:DNA polymerase III alpha subunit
VKALWDQIASFAEYGFNKSHAVAYTYLSSRMLWLKAHYPLEFFWAVMKCEGKFEKIKDIKIEAKKYGVTVNRVSINQSKIEFDIVGSEIFMGYSNIKGIGEEVARGIIAKQPYASFEDFLARYGTETTVLKPLIGLGLFPGDRATLHEYLEYYKDQVKKKEDRAKRFAKSKEKIIQEMAFLLPDTVYAPEFLSICELLRDGSKAEFVSLIQSKNIIVDVDQAYKVFKKYKKSVEGYAQKVADDHILSYSEFKPLGKLEDKYKEIYSEIPQVAEEIYYGFAWDHLLEYSPDYQGGLTFASLEDSGMLEAEYVECQVVAKPKEKVSKKNTVYYTVDVEDANGEKQTITVWSDDYKKFQEEFEFWEGSRKGSCMQLKVSPPGPGFKSYTMYSPSKQTKHRIIPKEKEHDNRLLLMRRPVLKVENGNK